MLKRRRPLLATILGVAAAPLGTILLAGSVILVGDPCSTDSAGTTATTAAAKSIPPNLLSIYQQVGGQYDLPWQILAGIGQEECDQGRSPDPSCTPHPGAQGPGLANHAGASGPMQIGIGSQAGDTYDHLRHYLPTPSSDRTIRRQPCSSPRLS